MADELFFEEVVLPSSGKTVRLDGKLIKAWGGQVTRAIIDQADGPEHKGLSDEEWDEAQAVLNAKYGL